MADLDAQLRESFARISSEGDPTGVAASILARVDAGDVGSPASTREFGASSFFSLLPWISLIVVAGLVGGSLGALGAFGSSTTVIERIPYSAVLDDAVVALDCPGGSPVGEFIAGERVLAIARSQDSAWLAVRDPYNFSSTVWLSAGVVVVDAGAGSPAELPVEGCVAGSVEAEKVPKPAEKPKPVASNAPDPALDKPKPPTKDTSKPTLTSAKASPSTITMEGYSAYCGTDVSVVSVGASDNKGVASVKATWSGGSKSLTKSGNSWKFSFSGTSSGSPKSYPITLVAKDAAGNASAPKTVTVTVTYCLI